MERVFLMYTDTFSIRVYRVSIPRSLMCCFTASMETSSLWKIPAARVASTSVFSKTSEKCSSFPAPLEAIVSMCQANGSSILHTGYGDITIDSFQVNQSCPTIQNPLKSVTGGLHICEVEIFPGYGAVSYL